jgi:hypothetical protein
MFIQTQWCDWCGDFGGPTLHSCEKCNHKICAAPGAGQPGCIRGDTVSKKNTFHCPDCSIGGLKVRHHTILQYKLTLNYLLPQYWVQGYCSGGPKNTKIMWPLVVLAYSLRTSSDNHFAARRIALDVDHEYRGCPNNVSTF